GAAALDMGPQHRGPARRRRASRGLALAVARAARSLRRAPGRAADLLPAPVPPTRGRDCRDLATAVLHGPRALDRAALDPVVLAPAARLLLRSPEQFRFTGADTAPARLPAAAVD